MTDELAERRRKRQLSERQRLLEESPRWTPREALEAVLIDMDLGELTDVEAITVVVSRTEIDDGEKCSVVQNYTGSNGVDGPKQTFWIVGMLNRAIARMIT